MKVSLWAEIRRLAEIEKLSGRVIAQRLHCSRHTVAAALAMQQPPPRQGGHRTSRLDPYLDKINGSGRSACFHPEFLALCGYFCMQPVPCARRDPESKGIVEGGVRYVKGNALAGRTDELLRFEDYLALAIHWRDDVANLRIHETTRERPLDRVQQERPLLRPLPPIPYDTDEIAPAVVSPHARIEFDGNRCWPNAAAGNFPRPRSRLQNDAN